MEWLVSLQRNQWSFCTGIRTNSERRSVNRQQGPVMHRIAALLFVLLYAAAAHADEASVKRTVEARFGGIKVESITKTPYFGLYEMLVGEEIMYTDEKVTYIFNGSVIDAKTRRNLTEERLQKLSAIKFDDLPLDIAIKQVRGNGKRVVAVFSDPNCPYCKRFEATLEKIGDITVHIFLYPVIKPESVALTKSVWCSRDRAKAWNDLMLRGIRPRAAPDCDTPVEKLVQLGRRLGAVSTPTWFLPDGERRSGAMPLEQLLPLLDKTSSRS